MLLVHADESPGALENALSHLQCVLVARRTRYTPEAMSWPQYDILELLRLQGPATPSLLGDKLGAGRPGISKSLRVLKDLGLVEQIQGNGDRREMVTALTLAGRDFLVRAATGRREAARIAAAVLTPGEQAMFTELCDKVSFALANHDADQGGNT